MSSYFKKALIIIGLSSFFIFIGRGLQLVVWDAPFRAFFWDESLLKGVVENLFGTPWEKYVTSRRTDINIQLFIKFCGILLIMASAVTGALYIGFIKNIKWIYIGVFVLFCIAFLEFKEKFKQAPQFFEASLQIGTPLVYLLMLKKISTQRILLICKILIALTFTAHGLYALGVYSLPAHFVEMFIKILSVSETQAKILLHLFGILDIITAIALFVPNKKVVNVALMYAFIWGILTAVARLVFNWLIHFNPISSLSSIHEFLFRICHGLVPLAVIYLTKHLNEKHYEKY